MDILINHKERSLDKLVTKVLQEISSGIEQARKDGIPCVMPMNVDFDVSAQLFDDVVTVDYYINGTPQNRLHFTVRIPPKG